MPDVAPGAGLRFRTAREADVPVLVALVNGAFRGDAGRTGWTSEADMFDGPRTDDAHLRPLVTATDSLMLLCLRGDEIVGTVQLQRQADAGGLGMFSVRPSLQGAGVGKQLLARAEALVNRQWGLPRMRMTVVRKRPELVAFYERRGYRHVGVQPFPPEWAHLSRIGPIEMVVLEKDLAG